MNEYQIAMLCGVAIAALWLLAYILCWLGQWAWAWIDDSQPYEKNLLARSMHFSKWKYPVYNTYGRDLEKAASDGRNPHGYAKDEKLKNGGIGTLREGVDYKYGFNIYGAMPAIVLLSSLIPFLAVLSFNIYPVALTVLTLMVVAWFARFSRRHKKLFDKHIKDKDAHK